MYDLNKCREFLKENNFEVNENDEVKVYEFWNAGKVKTWADLKNIVAVLNADKGVLVTCECVVANLLFNNKEELQTDEQDVCKVIENNLKKIGFSKAKCTTMVCGDDYAPWGCAGDIAMGYEIYFGVVDYDLEKPIIAAVGGEIETNLVSLEELDKKTFSEYYDVFIDIYNKLVKLYKLENYVEEVKEAVE